MSQQVLGFKFRVKSFNINFCHFSREIKVVKAKQDKIAVLLLSFPQKHIIKNPENKNHQKNQGEIIKNPGKKSSKNSRENYQKIWKTKIFKKFKGKS